MTKLTLKQIWNERRTNIWLWAEILLVSVVLWIIVDYGYVLLRTYIQPKGFNIENTYLLRFNYLTPKSERYIPQEQRTTTTGEDMLTIIERIRHRPEVQYVSISQNSYPYNNSNSWNTLVHDTIRMNRLRRAVTPDFFNVFQYENVDGSGSQSLADALTHNSLVVTSNLLPDENKDLELLGMQLQIDGDTTNTYRISAVTNPVRYDDFSPLWSSRYYAEGIKEEEIAEYNGDNIGWLEICVRVQPGTPKDFAETIMKESPRNYMVGNCYIKIARSFDQMRESFNRREINDLKTRGYIVFFLLINIFLGIIGTFWFRTQQRRSEMGLRIAFGSTHRSLYGLLVRESVWILVLAFIPAMIICYNIGHLNLAGVWQMEWGMARFIPGIIITFVLMVIMILIGISYPAHKATQIQPAEALHEE